MRGIVREIVLAAELFCDLTKNLIELAILAAEHVLRYLKRPASAICRECLEDIHVDGIAAAVEANPAGDIYPAIYVRKDNAVTEHLLPSNPLLDFETAEHRKQLADAVAPLGL